MLGLGKYYFRKLKKPQNLRLKSAKWNQGNITLVKTIKSVKQCVKLKVCKKVVLKKKSCVKKEKIKFEIVAKSV